MSNSAGGGKANPPSTRTDPATRSGARELASAVTKAPIEWPTRTGRAPKTSAIASTSAACVPRP